MRNTSAVVLVAMTLGCAMTPLEIREAGERFIHNSRLPPQEAAACLGRAAEDHNAEMRALWRTTTQGRYELLLSMSYFTHVIADVAPQSTGSTATIYVQPHMAGFIRARLIEAMLKGC